LVTYVACGVSVPNLSSQGSKPWEKIKVTDRQKDNTHPQYVHVAKLKHYEKSFSPERSEWKIKLSNGVFFVQENIPTTTSSQRL